MIITLSESALNAILPMEAIIFEKDISLDYHIAPDVLISRNTKQIIQVIMILLDNAIKYTHPKGSLTASLVKQHNTALLSVTNTGDGIAEQDLDKIFDRFYVELPCISTVKFAIM